MEVIYGSLFSHFLDVLLNNYFHSPPPALITDS